MAVLKKIKFGESTNNIAKTVVQGKPKGVISVSNTSGFNNDDSEDKDYSYDIDVNVDNATIVNDNGALKVGTVPAAQVSVADNDGVFTAENVETALKELKDDIAEVGSEAKSYEIIKETSKTKGVTLESNVLEQYKLQQTVNGKTSIVGETIKIYKDSSLKSVALNGQNLDFTYILADGTEKTVSVDVSTFLAESEFKDGLQVVNHEVSAKLGQGLEFGGETGENVNQSIKVKIDSTSENFLTVGANGVKLAGVQDAINAAKAAATTKLKRDSDASHLIVLQREPAADGSVTYTIGESDIASKTALDAEIAARKAVDGQDGQTYAASNSANYIKNATSLNDADVKLDAAIKAVSDKTDAIQYKVTGTTLEFFGIESKS